MRFQPSESHSHSFLGDLARRARKALSGWGEIGRLDAGQVEALARDLNLSFSELNSLAIAAPTSLESLKKRLALAGLSEEALAVSDCAVLRDLQRVCSQCASKARCAADLRRGQIIPPKYCPNEETLHTLRLGAAKPAPGPILASHAIRH
ncbi:MAG TPA: hypothetical protein VKR55_02675 [Bradyrhizobium sp.]|uniref:hypothetical protein n=1 Tax=Bradyrhizobium sp. TaxID=376 RepID=UPI002B798FC3|nr:hypothetical protein [Bradyrhizobium sp.]HLZ01037.1 hypothetical protein [Bradyrhizobium sp.]